MEEIHAPVSLRIGEVNVRFKELQRIAGSELVRGESLLGFIFCDSLLGFSQIVVH